MLADPARVHGNAGVLADEVVLVIGDRDVLDDGVEYALPRDRRLALLSVGERIAEILRDVLQRPDVEIRRSILDRVLKIGRDRAHPRAFSAAAAPARLPKTVHSSSELPIIRLRPCVPPAISPHANTPSSVVSPWSSITRPPFW